MMLPKEQILLRTFRACYRGINCVNGTNANIKGNSLMFVGTSFTNNFMQTGIRCASNNGKKISITNNKTIEDYRIGIEVFSNQDNAVINIAGNTEIKNNSSNSLKNDYGIFINSNSYAKEIAVSKNDVSGFKFGVFAQFNNSLLNNALALKITIDKNNVLANNNTHAMNNEGIRLAQNLLSAIIVDNNTVKDYTTNIRSVNNSGNQTISSNICSSSNIYFANKKPKGIWVQDIPAKVHKVTVNNNKISETYIGIQAESISSNGSTNGLFVTDNTVTKLREPITSTATDYTAGIVILNCRGEVTGNNISTSGTSISANVRGIYSRTTLNSLISCNQTVNCNYGLVMEETQVNSYVLKNSCDGYLYGIL